MTERNNRINPKGMKSLMKQQEDFLKPLVQRVVQEVLEAEMEEAVGAAKGERTENRLSYRSGYYNRELITRIGVLELRVPQDRNGVFSTQVFERYQRSEKALVATLIEMYVQGVSTRKVKAITEELCGHEFSASTISTMNKKLDEEMKRFNSRSLEGKTYPYVIVDARYEKVRQAGVVQSQAVLIALGINEAGQREVLAVELANRESNSSWKEFLAKLLKRHLLGVKLIISDDHAGLRSAIKELFCGVAWQRCYVHFLRNALDYLPGKRSDDCLTELRWLYQRKNIQEAQKDLKSWLEKWQSKYPKLCDWIEDNIAETLNFYHQAQAHHRHLKSTNLLERLNQEIKRRTKVIRIFPDEASCLRLIGALAQEIHEDWMEARYLNMELLETKTQPSLLALAA